MRETLVIPSRIRRVGCGELKERRMPDAPYIVTGVRWAESAGRRAKSGIAKVYAREPIGRMDEYMTARLHVGAVPAPARKV